VHAAPDLSVLDAWASTLR